MQFCPPIYQSNFRAEFYSDLPVDFKNVWAKHTQGNLYLSKIVQDALKEGLGYLHPIYAFVYDTEKLIGLGLIQHLEVKHAKKQILPYIKYVPNSIVNLFLDDSYLEIFCNGNAYLNGENAFISIDEYISIQDFAGIWVEFLDKFQTQHVQKLASFMLVKEFYQSNTLVEEKYLKKHFRKFNIGDVMHMPLREKWRTMDNYFEDLTSKYRTRCNQTYQKSREIRTIEFNLKAIEENLTTLDVLLTQVVDNADFKLVEVNAQCIMAFKLALEDEFVVKGYYLGDKLVGFSAFFIHTQEIDAHIVGFEYEINKQYHIYQRMLLDFVEAGIALGKAGIRFGRTSELIKSSLGAQPHSMYLFLKHRNCFLNVMMKPILARLKMKAYEVRNPFKQLARV